MAQRLLMVRTTHAQMGGHRLVQGGGGMTGVWAAVVKVVVGKAGVAHVGGALWGARRQCPGCSSRVEKSSWGPHRRAACPCGDTQVRRASSPPPRAKEGARCAGGAGLSPLTCGGEQESDVE